ncbi:MAG TPA: hypothetical protein VMM79_09380 [Longimicrobiales bacterium]|nr:hypothetical protein [Longimicrobiales bacterium]
MPIRQHMYCCPKVLRTGLPALVLIASASTAARAQHSVWDPERGADAEIRFTPVIGWTAPFTRHELRSIVLEDRVARGEFDVKHQAGLTAGAMLEFRSFGPIRLTAGALYVSGGEALETADQGSVSRSRPTADFVLAKAGIVIRIHEREASLQRRSLNVALSASPAYVLAVPQREPAGGGRESPFGSPGLNLGIDAEAPFGGGAVGLQVSVEDFIVFWNRGELERRMDAEFDGAGVTGRSVIHPDPSHMWVLRAGLTFRLR